MVGAAVSRLLIPGSEISFFLVSLRPFHMRAPAPCRLHPQSKRTAEPLTFDGESVREREREIVHRRNKRRHVVHYFICTVQKDVSASAKEISWGYTGKHKDG